MRDPGSGFAWFHRARHGGWRLSHIGSALTLLLAACSSAPLPPRASTVPRAAVEPRRAALSYLAPPACPGDGHFVEHVQSRSTRLQLEPESLAASLPEQVHVSVEPDPSGAGWLGELRIVGRSALVREVRGERCEDVVAALALITVLRLERSDGSAAGSTGRVPGTTTAGEQTPPGETSAAGRLSAPTGEATSETKPTPPAEAAVEQPTPEEPTPEEPTPEEPTAEGVEEPTATDVEEPTPRAEMPVEERATPGVAAEPSIPAGARGDVDESADGARSDDAGSAGPMSLETSVFGHLGYSSMPSHAIKAALGAELRLGETAASWSGALSLALARGSDLSADGTSELTLLTAELRLCPPGVSLDALSLRGCAQLSGGRLGLSLSPNRVLATTDVDRPWVAMGPSVDAGLSLTPRWTLRVTSALMFHLIRDTFGRAPTADDADPEARVPLYRPEAISLELLLGIGYTF